VGVGEIDDWTREQRRCGKKVKLQKGFVVGGNSAYQYGSVASPLNAMGDDYDLGGIPVIPPNVPGNYGVVQEHREYESGRI
jgi:hypothetical protein